MTSPLRSSVLQAQSALTQAQTEVSTGTYADIGLQLGGGTGQLLSLRSSVDSLNVYTQTNAVASTRLSATNSALTSMLSTAQSLSATLTTAHRAPARTTDGARHRPHRARSKGLIGQPQHIGWRPIRVRWDRHRQNARSQTTRRLRAAKSDIDSANSKPI